MSDFSDRPFVAGSLIGLRAFAVDKYGRLLGPSFAQVFKPGENEAGCRKSDDGMAGMLRAYSNLSASLSAASWRFTVDPFAYGGPIPKKPQPETYGTGPCPCGCGQTVEFHDGTLKRGKPKAPSAAEIEAAVPKVDTTALVKVEHVLGGVKCTCGFYAYFDGLNDYKDPSRVAAIIEGYGVCTVGDRGFRASKARLVALIEPKAQVSPLLRERLHRNYPDVPFYATKREAVDAHPLTPPPAPGPDDDDFWTRPPS